MNPELIAAALRLPVEAKRALVEQGGPGTWTLPDGCSYHVRPEPWWNLSEQEIGGRLVDRGWVWLPFSEVAWMKAATPENGTWSAISDPSVWNIWGTIGSGAQAVNRKLLGTGPTAQECALKAWGVL